MLRRNHSGSLRTGSFGDGDAGRYALSAVT